MGKLGNKSPPRAGQLPLYLDASTILGCDFILHTNNEYYSPIFLLGKMVPGFHMAQHYVCFCFCLPYKTGSSLTVGTVSYTYVSVTPMTRTGPGIKQVIS